MTTIDIPAATIERPRLQPVSFGWARYPAAGKRRGPIALLAPARRIVERETLAGLAVRPARQIEDDAAVGEIDLDPVKQ